MDAAAAIRIQSMARVRMSRRVAATRTVLKTKRDHFVSLLAPLYEELYDLPAAKDEEQHTRLLHRLIIKNVVGVDGDSLTDVAVESMEALVHELRHKRSVRVNKMNNLRSGQCPVSIRLWTPCNETSLCTARCCLGLGH